MPMDNYQVILQELVRRSNEETRRLRMLEQKMDSLDDKLNSLLENNTERTKKINTKTAEVDVSLKNLSNEILNLKVNVDKINKQLVKFAQRRDLKEIERMLELLSPLREEFATKEDLEELKKQEEEEKIV
ncbi:MAG: hypothetical protein NT120_02335 [Candidatus Aenigmarchaeota archaeon]|nr:hypothetical protein [Candidatus Aenigmarchaeota archaeon]